MIQRNTDIVCKNIFKSEDDEKIRKEFLKKWVELINLFEKTKQTTTQT